MRTQRTQKMASKLFCLWKWTVCMWFELGYAIKPFAPVFSNRFYSKSEFIFALFSIGCSIETVTLWIETCILLESPQKLGIEQIRTWKVGIFYAFLAHISHPNTCHISHTPYIYRCCFTRKSKQRKSNKCEKCERRWFEFSKLKIRIRQKYAPCCHTPATRRRHLLKCWQPENIRQITFGKCGNAGMPEWYWFFVLHRSNYIPNFRTLSLRLAHNRSNISLFDVSMHCINCGKEKRNEINQKPFEYCEMRVLVL